MLAWNRAKPRAHTLHGACAMTRGPAARAIFKTPVRVEVPRNGGEHVCSITNKNKTREKENKLVAT